MLKRVALFLVLALEKHAMWEMFRAQPALVCMTARGLASQRKDSAGTFPLPPTAYPAVCSLRNALTREMPNRRWGEGGKRASGIKHIKNPTKSIRRYTSKLMRKKDNTKMKSRKEKERKPQNDLPKPRRQIRTIRARLYRRRVQKKKTFWVVDVPQNI